MSDLHTLKKQREDILARMDMTRTRYRAEMLINRRLAAGGHHDEENLRFAHDVQSDHFPRSATMRLLMRHPYAAIGAAAAAAGAFALLGPRTSVRAAGATALRFVPNLIAHSKYGPLVARAMPYIKQYLAWREARTLHRGTRTERARHASAYAADAADAVTQADSAPYHTRNYARGAGADQRFERSVHHEHLQTTPTIH